MRKKIANSRIAKVIDYKRVFLSEPGKRVLADMMKRHCVMDSSFDPNPAIHAFRSGQAAVVQEIFKVLKLDVNDLQNRILEEENNAT